VKFELYNGLYVRTEGIWSASDHIVEDEVKKYDIGDKLPNTVLDIGANIGAFSHWLLQQNPRANIIAVEPNVENFYLLSLNLGYYKTVRLIPAAVSYRTDNPTLLVDPNNAGGHYLNSTSEPMPSHMREDSVNTVELSELGFPYGDAVWDDTIDLLKIDVEGAELDILMHCRAMYLQDIRRIIGEWHYTQDVFWTTVGQRLRDLGFSVELRTNTYSQPPHNRNDRYDIVAINQGEL
jgi:FkbM family methyltransferase